MEIGLQANNERMTENHYAHQLTSNSIDSSANSSSGTQHATYEKQLEQLSLSTRAEEFFAIFEDAFDQLNIIDQSLSTQQLDPKEEKEYTNCDPVTLNLIGILT